MIGELLYHITDS